MQLVTKLLQTLNALENCNTNLVNSHIRTLLGLKSIRSSLPYNEGSRTMYLLNAHQPFGLTALYATQSLNLLTAHINSSEFDEDIAILNKPLKAQIYTKVEKKIPNGWKIVAKNGPIKKGELIAKGQGPFDELRANISGNLRIAMNKLIIESNQQIGTGSKIQNIFLQKHVLKTEYNRFKFVSTNEHPITPETIENLERASLTPIVVDMTKHNIEKPTIITGTNSIFKRRAAGHLAQCYVGFRHAFTTNDIIPKTELEWKKEVIVTKVYDSKTDQYFDAIIGIPCWLIAITSGGYEYNIGLNNFDMIGRSKNSVSIDPFAYKVLKYKHPEIAEAILEFQLEKRKECLKEYLSEL